MVPNTKFLTTVLLVIAALPGVTQQNTAARFDSLTKEYQSHNFQGVILVAKADKIIYNKAWGYADMDKKIPLATKTLFKTESTGKMYTATAILQLVDKGWLKTSQSVKELLPGLPLKNADKITVHHLLMHTSGLQSPWDHPDFKFKKIYSRAEMEKIVTDLPLVFDQPGKEMYYSNSGYIILSWIVEKVSGLSFDDYLAANIFQPQNMRTIRHLNDTIMPAGEAQPYRFLNSKKYISLPETVGPKASGAGGWIATADDLYRFLLGLDQNKYFSTGTLESMITAGNWFRRDSSYHSYAYGVEIFNKTTIQSTTYFGHSGGGAGFSIDAILDPVSHHIIIFCSNTYMNGRPVTANYLRLALGLPAEKISQPDEIKVYDKLEKVGIDNFIKNGKEYFQSLNVQPNDWLFNRVADAMYEAGDHTTMIKWLEYGSSYYPQNGFLYLLKADGLLALGKKEEAKQSLDTVRAIAEKNNDQRMILEVEKKMKQAGL